MKQKLYEFWIGLVVLVALAMLAVLIVGFGEFEFILKKPYRVTAYFANSSGIKRGTSVRLIGVEIGQVTDVYLVPGEKTKVGMTLKIQGDKRIKQDATLKIRQEGLIANFFLEFDGGSPDAADLPVDGSAEVYGAPAFSIERALRQLSERTKKLEKSAESFDKLMVNLDKIAGDEEFQRNVKESARKINGAAANIAEIAQRGKETLAKIDTASDDADKLFKELTDTVEQVKDTIASIREFVVKLDQTVARQSESADDFIRRLNTNSESLEKLLQSLLDISEAINQGKGTMGRMVTGDELHRELIATLKKSQEMVDSIRQTIEYIEKHPESLIRGRKEEKKKKKFLIF